MLTYLLSHFPTWLLEAILGVSPRRNAQNELQEGGGGNTGNTFADFGLSVSGRLVSTRSQKRPKRKRGNNYAFTIIN